MIIMSLLAWLIYLIIISISYRWLLTPIQVFYLCEIGAHVLFVRKLGIYLIRLSSNVVNNVANRFSLTNGKTNTTF